MVNNMIICHLFFNSPFYRKICKEVLEKLSNNRIWSRGLTRAERYVILKMHKMGALVLKREYPGKRWYYVPNTFFWSKLLNECSTILANPLKEYRRLSRYED